MGKGEGAAGAAAGALERLVRPPGKQAGGAAAPGGEPAGAPTERKPAASDVVKGLTKDLFGN